MNMLFLAILAIIVILTVSGILTILVAFVTAMINACDEQPGSQEDIITNIEDHIAIHRLSSDMTDDEYYTKQKEQ